MLGGMMRRYFSRRLVALPVAVSLFVLSGIPTVALADPSPQLLEVTTNTTLNDDWYGSVVITAPNVTFDCAGYSIIGPGWDPGGEEFGGVIVEPSGASGPVDGVTVRNCNIVNHVGGFSVGADGTTLENNTVDGSARGTGGFGIFSDNNLIVNNLASNVSFDGFLLRGEEFGDPVQGNLLQGNRAQNNVSNFSLEYADSNTLTGNTASGSGEGGLGFQVAISNGNHLEANTATNLEAGFAVGGADNNTFLANTTTGGSGWRVGFDISNSHGNQFTRNQVSKAIFGFWLTDSTGNMVEANSFTEPHEEESTGILLYPGSDENQIEGNYLTDLTVGIRLEGSSLNKVEANVVLRSSENGIDLFEAHENVVEGNRSQHNAGNGYWVLFSDLNLFESNKANTNGMYGFFEFGSTDNSYSDNKCGGNKEGASDPDGLC
jgi:parallel beta-helix repeat protein